MHTIQIDPYKESYISGYKKLVEAKNNDKEAQLNIFGLTLTTDMIPENYKSMDFGSVILETTKRAKEQISGTANNKIIEPKPKMRIKHSHR